MGGRGGRISEFKASLVYSEFQDSQGYTEKNLSRKQTNKFEAISSYRRPCLKTNKNKNKTKSKPNLAIKTLEIGGGLERWLSGYSQQGLS